MISGTAWFCILGALAVVGLVGTLANWWQRAARRRARHAYYARAGQDTTPMPLSSAPVPLTGGISPKQAAGIRAHAERTAQKDWATGYAEVRYPYDNGTPEYVLWYATYHLRMGELAEEAEAQADAAREAQDGKPTQ